LSNPLLTNIKTLPVGYGLNGLLQINTELPSLG